MEPCLFAQTAQLPLSAYLGEEADGAADSLEVELVVEDLVVLAVLEGPLVDVRTVLALPVPTIRDRTSARMGQLLPGFRLVQLEDGRGAPITKDLSALMEADLTM